MATKKKYVQVDEAWIKQVHSEVCSDWKETIENKFPAIFPKKYMLLNKPFISVSGDKCILIKSPFDKDDVILIYGNGRDALTCKEYVKNGKITEKDFEEEIHSKVKNYI